MRRPASLALLVLAGALCSAPTPAQAAEAPHVDATWATGVSASAATVSAEVNPEGAATTYRFEYIAEGPDYAAHGFEHATKQPSGAPAGLGAGTSDILATQHLVPLSANTTYHYRVSATNSAGTTPGPDRTFTTQESSPPTALPDSRGWEMVSPVDKNGGGVQGPEANYGGDVLQAAAGGGALTYSSSSAFGQAPAGAPPASQYLARREAGGWSTENVTAPTLSGAYGSEPDGVPYRLFSEDLARGLMQNGRRCTEAEPCPRSYSLWEGGTFTPLPEAAAGMRVIGASPDLGRILFEDEGGEAYEWSGGAALAPIAPPASEAGVLGTSADGQTVYFQDGAGLKRRREATTTTIVAGPQAAQESDYPPGAGTARVSADGETLLFLSQAELTGYDNTDQATGEPDSEVFLYETGGGGTLRCLSCNPTNARPLGPATIPGAIANGTTRIYKPRNLAAGGRRVFFDSADALVPADSDGRPDVYQWEAQGSGSCAKPGGCLGLISGGRSGEASFIDASESGADAFFLTEASLIGQDPGSVDLYDARVGGGFPEPTTPIECTADACQPLPEPPEDPTVGTTIPGPPNPPLRVPKPRCPKGTHRVVRHGKTRCVPRHRKRRGHR